MGLETFEWALTGTYCPLPPRWLWYTSLCRAYQIGYGKGIFPVSGLEQAMPASAARLTPGYFIVVAVAVMAGWEEGGTFLLLPLRKQGDLDFVLAPTH